MATSSNFEEFSVRMLLRSKEYIAAREAQFRRAAVILDTRLVMSTPVDTGRARGNWTCAIGAAQELLLSDTAAGFPSADEAMASARQTIAGWDIHSGPIFVANSLPYIMRLEHGWSAQAPAGMTTQAIAAAKEELRRKLKWE